MAKTTLKKKISKKKVKKVKKSSEVMEDSTEVSTEVVYDEEEDEDVNKADENISSGEEEDGEDDRRHQKLLEAINSLGAKRKRTLGERSEAAVQMSEYGVNAEGEGDKVDLSDLIGTLEKTPAVSAKTKKQLKGLQKSQRTIECPLSKQESDRIHRDVSFQKAASEVTRWKGIIQQNQRAEQLVFPLNQEPSGPKPMERVVLGWKARTPLEEEIFALLHANKQPIHDPVLTPAEEASMRAMSLEEAKIRRAELQKSRALQSYYESRARRERKIKSKKYHKVQNKAKRKDFLKQFDEMVKSDPAAALEELNRMELARMQERMSLKHQNSGKWAKSKAIMAKYDEGARKAMQQQLEVNKDLTQKLQTTLDKEEEEEEEEEEQEVLPDFVNDAERGGVDSSNPWMRGTLTEEPMEKEEEELTAAKEEEPAAEEEEEEVKETEEETLLREFDRKRKQRQAEETETITVMDDEEEEEEKVAVEEKEEEEKAAAEEEKVEEEKEEEKEEVKAAAEEEEGEEEEEEQLSEFTNLYREISEKRREAERPDTTEENPSAHLDEGLTRIRTLEDADELLTQEESATPEQTPAAESTLPAAQSTPPARQKAGKLKKRKRGIELKEVLTKDTKVVQVPLARTIEDAEDMDEELDQRGLIKEAFAGDDVVSDFLKDKRKQENAGKPKVVDLTLPGWGEWGGTGLFPSRKKRRRFRIKQAPPPPRRDQSLPSVIISERRNSSITLHQVNTLPFPFQTHAQFESTIRTPLGRTWNTEQTVRKISKPKVVTQLGAIIEPMGKEELMKDKKETSAASKNVEETERRRQKRGRRERNE
ncbi:U3 small nucleolar RNA-associated protein 14 homolog A [Notolabrus celidotus]|uniref:U3 small nucleolar RNA-associated protein 14 homolog A n=1 Tax=Notolabrus celidotus TaxID=1203425 RepID=UPI00148FCEE8|nr:U3 small nucleolar RNA-associated protein 14 homolog A [Notolabrus celidotus]